MVEFRLDSGRPSRYIRVKWANAARSNCDCVVIKFSMRYIVVPHIARVAQLVEQRTENPRVGGSNPPPGTTFQVQRSMDRGSSDCFQTINVLEQELVVPWCG